MSESIEIIISQFGKLAEKEQKQIITGLTRHLGEPIQFSKSGLSIYNEDELEIISNTLKGLILTIENVPDILDAYERLEGKDLPRKISFGNLKNSGK
ncbi:hypothetical protein [Paenibacillus sp. Leaf72]|uniref:hypothetical protein n=1 Tax=Paenibacillus sp. Leaf72 TaxID=1736234 RepID=UPI0006F69F52|nr:hypothetical protein [Paenibacillus sp. Leaf72]KQO17857.1 hypothetical protein ASF12_04150 [Paenibacillus sp. Leaf72]